MKKRVELAWLQPLVWAWVLVVFTGQTVSAGNPQVIYDKASDTLSLQADTVSLEGLLARIALLSGVEFLLDREAEQPVSITLEGLPLEKGLKKIMEALDLRYAMIYQKKKGQEPLLISMKIVPEGKEDNPHLSLEPVVHVNGEAVVRSLPGRRPSAGKTTVPTILDYAQERWQARLDKMPEEKRRRIEERIKQKQEKRAAHMEEMENRREEREKRAAERRARRLAAEERLRVSNPELYELRQQRREEIRQQVMEELNQ